MKKILFQVLFSFACLVKAQSQNYHAIHGSSYAGSLGVSNNPSSIVNTGAPWDVTVFSLQVASSTNAITILNYSLISNPAASLYRINGKAFERYANGNYNLRLLNTRITLNRKSALAFGANLRGYLNLNTSKYNFADSVKNIRNFLKINNGIRDLRANVQGNNWLEVFGTFSRTLWDREQGRLNAGITVRATRGIAGAYGGFKGVAATGSAVNNKPFYFGKAESVRYGYSSTLDKWVKGRPASQNIGSVVSNSENNLSLDLGIEYLVKYQSVPSFNDEDNYYDYEWKIGISLLDLGKIKYAHGIQSRITTGPMANIADTILQRKFNSIKKIASFNDSLATVFPGVQELSGAFNFTNPARLVINVDRYLQGDFYLNGELSANLSSVNGKDKLYSSEISFLTVTPRWETRIYGAYLPVQINSERQFWVGAAVKAGPLLLGVHNLANIFSRNKMQNGGGYIAFVIRPGKTARVRTDKRLDCPEIP